MAYIYRHIRLDKNEPFYIGIGTDANYKRAKNKSNRNNVWKRIFDKTRIKVEILLDNIDLEFAKKKEVEFIKLYGKIVDNNGILANISGGADGKFYVGESTRKHLSEIFKGDGNPFYGKTHSLSTKLKISLSKKGIKTTPKSEETRLKISLANKGQISWIKGKKDPIAAKKRSGVNHPSYRGKISSYDLLGNKLHTFECIRDLCDFYDINNTNKVRRVITGNRKTHKNMIYKYEND